MPKILSLLALACGWVLLAPAGALAAAATKLPDHGESTPLELPATETKHLASGGGGGGLARTFIGLAVVVAVIYGVAWVLKQMKSVKEEQASGRGLSTAASLPLGQGRSLHLIRAGRELILVGSAEHGVVPIRTYTEQEALDLGLIGEDDDDLDGGVGPTHPERGRRRPTSGLAGLGANVVDAIRRRTAR
jgi:flagellar protein FliO/FliZ